MTTMATRPADTPTRDREERAEAAGAPAGGRQRGHRPDGDDHRAHDDAQQEDRRDRPAARAGTARRSAMLTIPPTLGRRPRSRPAQPS